MSTMNPSPRPQFSYNLPRVLSPVSTIQNPEPTDQAAHTLMILRAGAASKMTTDAAAEAPAKYPSPQTSMLPAMPGRRQSRFDPMGRGDDDDDVYGDLGQRHPLRRIQEDVPDKKEQVSLPSIKSLLDNAPPSSSPSSSTPFPLFHSPGLPSLSNSPSSSTRTSRYSSINSSVTSSGDAHPGWWNPDDGPQRMAYPQPRNDSFARIIEEEPDFKRRRSDGPPQLRDAEESARLRWQAQSRNASYPVVSPGLSSSMGRPSISGPLPMSPPEVPGHDRRDSSFPFDRRESGYSLDRRDSSLSVFDRRDSSLSAFDRRDSSASRRDSTLSVMRRESTVSRSSSFTAPLARSFADLSATDRNSPVELPMPRSPADMMPPPERRPSLFQRSATDMAPMHDRSPRPPSASSSGRSLTRPPSPEPTPIRRSSLTELIKSQSGDDVIIARGGYFEHKPAAPEPISGWPRRSSADSAASAPSISLNSDTDTPGATKRRHRADPPHNATPTVTVDPPSGDPMQAMDVLAAESARRAADVDRVPRGDEDDDRETSPSKGVAGPKYACAYCAKTFSRPSSLRIHTYSHTGERPFVCPEPTCRRRFSVQSNLKRHAKVHQMGAPFAAAGPPHLAHPRGVHPPPAIYGYPPPHPHAHMAHHGMAHAHSPGPHGHGPHGHGVHPQAYPGGPPFAHQQPVHGAPGPPPTGAPYQPHFQTAPRPQMSEHMQAHYRELQRRRSEGQMGERGDEWDEEEDEVEEDELEDD